MSRLRWLVTVIALVASGQASAATVSYEFSGLLFDVFGYYSIEQAVAQQRAYLDANPGASTPGWRGSLSYDSVSGLLTVSLSPPEEQLLPGHSVDFGGVATTASPPDADTLSAVFVRDYSFPDEWDSHLAAFNHLNNPQFPVFTVQYLENGSYPFVLSAPGLIHGGELRSGMSASDLTTGYLAGFVGNVDVIYPCQTSNLECLYDGGLYHNARTVYLDGSSLVVFSISEMHQVPEPGGLLVAGGALLVLATMCHRRRGDLWRAIE